MTLSQIWPWFADRGPGRDRSAFSLRALPVSAVKVGRLNWQTFNPRRAFWRGHFSHHLRLWVQTLHKEKSMGAQWKAKGKAQAADVRGKLFGRLAKDIMIAARNGADPAANSRLRLVVEQARKVSMPKETLERAIKKGAGLLGDAVSFDRVIYEGFAPHQVPVMIEVLTDNVNRSASEMRVLFRKGQQGTSGSVSWDFDHVGMIEAEPAQAGADPELAAIEAGAQDFEPADEDGVAVFITEATDLDLVSRALPEHGFTVVSAKLGYKPKNPVASSNLSAEQLEEVEAFLGAIDNNDDVQNVFVGLAATPL
jgi:YebC/PmpR family DNA-binding regulatory protein